MKKLQNKLTIPQLKKELALFSQKELIQLIADCSKLNEEVQYYLSARFLGEEAIEELYEIYKKKIEAEFFPERGFGELRLSVAKKAIRDFKKLTGDERRTFELQLFYVEMGVDFTNEFGDIDETFYDSVEGMFRSVIQYLNKQETPDLYLEYKSLLAEIVEDTDGIGWGFHDGMTGIYSEIKWLEE